uniref:Uncharacterized protein n=1 Tax=Anguilla anguilla TaxID=7936 RepID=A0A0E9X953_ANGAN
MIMHLPGESSDLASVLC